MTAKQSVIRIPQRNDGFVLVSVSLRGPKPLDLNLLGTESEHPYFASLTEDELVKSKSKTDDLTDSAWFTTLAWVLLHQKPAKEYQKLVERVYVEASIEAEQIILTFRQNIEGLTPRIGSISLVQDDNKEVDLFEWAGILAESSTRAEQRAADIQAKCDAQAQAVENLNAQLQEFIETEKRQEDIMLERFRQLLNTKKLKIRDQQRLLAGAKVDPDAAKQVREARQLYTLGHAGGEESPSRRPKRKANGARWMIDDEEAAQAETESDDEFEVARTPHRSDGDESDTQEWTARGSEATPGLQLPPQRELPFSNKASGSAVSKKPEGPEDDDETDDEL